MVVFTCSVNLYSMHQTDRKQKLIDKNNVYYLYDWFY